MHKNKYFCKVVATLGPDTSTPEMIEKLVLAGVNVFRFNGSHGSYDEYIQRRDGIRAMEKKYNCSLAILFDLQGPKLRVGQFKNGPVFLKEGNKFTVDLSPEPGDESRVSLQHPEIFAVMHEGMELLLNDGIIRLRVDSFTSSSAQTTIMTSGELSDRKGVNVPGVKLPISAITEKDRADLKIAEEIGADFIALSFVQTADDIKELKSLMTSDAGIIAKIEKPSAVEHLREIIENSYGIMVARGDLGVEMRPEMVPVIQKKIITGCRKAGKPVIVATQMLESMIHNATPTRAEASDVATAVYEGADAVMLSAETANGKYPVEAVSTMRRIIETVEKDCRYRKNMTLVADPGSANTSEGAITMAATVAANTMETANIIVNFTDSGRTTIRTSKQRPCIPLLSLTPNIRTARKMSLVWGVTSIIVKDLETFDDISREAKQAVAGSGLASPGDQVVITAGIPFGKQGETNLLYVIKI
ncbi:pyruvate kinase [Parelusimicrobium proximum]|uniref:pyruvate kinase n=1 Tax=Parelusimicrobium proximum TaxID=3228953 RepID=UPI003D163AAF